MALLVCSQVMRSDRRLPLPDSVTDRPYVAVVGSGDRSGEGVLYEKAREVGRLVTEKGGTVVCGGPA